MVIPMADIDKMISEKFQRSPTFDFGDNPRAAKANINDLIADTYKARNAIAHGATPYEAVRDNVPTSERGGAGVGYGITYDPQPFGSIVVTTAKDGAPGDKRTVQTTYDAAAATADRVDAKRAAAAADAAAAANAAKKLDEEGGVKHDAFFGDITVRPRAEREAAKAAHKAEEEAKAEERAAAAADKAHFLGTAPQGRSLDDDLAAIEAGEVKESDSCEVKKSDINARMAAWKQATDHPERVSEFLKADKRPIRPIEDFAEWEPFMDEQMKKDHEGMKKLMGWSGFGKDPGDYQLVEDWYKVVSTPKSATDPRWDYIESKKKNFNKSEDISPEEYQDMADAAAEDSMDDFEAEGKKHMIDTKRERAKALKPVVDATADGDGEAAINGALITGHDAARDRDKLGDATLMDVDVDTTMYLESLMDKGLITPEQYAAARRAFREGRDAGLAGL